MGREPGLSPGNHIAKLMGQGWLQWIVQTHAWVSSALTPWPYMLRCSRGLQKLISGLYEIAELTDHLQTFSIVVNLQGCRKPSLAFSFGVCWRFQMAMAIGKPLDQTRTLESGAGSVWCEGECINTVLNATAHPGLQNLKALKTTPHKGTKSQTAFH